MTETAATTETLFRQREDREAEVTSVELFFDLVFVFAVTQVSHFLLNHRSWTGAIEASFLLLAVWSAWVDTVLTTNLLDPRRQAVRSALFALMALGLVFASALPEAFAERGLAFASFFVAFQLGRAIFMAWASRPRPPASQHFQRMSAWTVIYGAFWIGGALMEGPLRFAFWAVALLLDYVTPAFGYPVPVLGRSNLQEINIEGGHVAERVNLFVMIALGESVLVTGASFAELQWSPEVILAMAAGLLQSMAMWWIYFYWSSDVAKSVIAHANNPVRFILRAFGYVPWIVVAGIVTAAVGDELTLAEPTGPSGAAAWALIGGPALFMLGALLFEYGSVGQWSRIRLGALVALGLLIAAVPYVSALALSILTTAILFAVAITEHMWMARKHAMPNAPNVSDG